MTEKDAENLRKKIQVFKSHTHTQKNVFLTLLTVFGASKNKHFLDIVTNQSEVEDLFN